MANTNMFQTVKSAHPKKHFQDLSHSTFFDMDAGKLIPFCCFDLVPGDKVKIGTQTLIRAIVPFEAPQLTSLRVKEYFFAVPFRLLDENFPDFIAKKEGAIPPKTIEEYDPHDTPELPYKWLYQNGFAKNASGDIPSPEEKYAFRYTVADYLGLPIISDRVRESQSHGDYGLHMSIRKECLAFPWLAYNLIWNTRFRDEQLQAERSLFSNEVAKVNWKKDYFTSAFLTQQAGSEPVITTQQINFSEGRNALIKELSFERAQLGGSGASVLADQVEGVQSSITVSNRNLQGAASQTKIDDFKAYGTVHDPSGTGRDAFVASQIAPAPQYDYENNAEIQLDSEKFGFVFTPSAMRLGFAVQRFQEMLIRGGQRYEEYTQMMFGVSPGDARIQRPEYIGGCSNPVIVSEVIQTGASTEDNKLGKLGGHGLGAGVNYIGTYRAKEHCLVMGVMYLAPDLVYSSQGVPKWLSRRVPEDYYAPPFAWLSEQPIYEKEIFFTGNEANDEKVFGYQGIWNDMRCRQDDVRGALRDGLTESGLNFWHMARKFGNAPELNSDFIEMNPTERVFSIEGVPHWLCAVNTTIHAFRPMPKYSDPGLVDHVYGM